MSEKNQKISYVRERYSWSQWESLLRGFLNAIWAANRKKQKAGGVFAEILWQKLEANEELKKLVVAKPDLARKVIPLLPCARQTIYNFVIEVCSKK